MSEAKEGIFSCKGMSWIIGALLGVAAFLILRGRLEMGLILALLISVVLLVAVALLLQRFFCAEDEQSAAASPVASSPAATPAAVAKPAAKPAAKPTEKPADAPAAPAEVSKSDASGADGGSKSADAAKASTAKTTKAAKPAAKAVAKDGKPEVLTGPRDGGADDLKLLKGVGPKLEQTLNELGFYHFDQVAKWRKKEVEWVDSRLTFKGRIERDGWISQAKILAEGGSTEFSKKAKKGK